MRQHRPDRWRVGRSGGFTIVEMMAVLMILILMLSVGVAAVDSFMKEQGPEAGLRIVRGCLFAAKMQAIRERKKVEFDARPIGSVASFTVSEAPTGSVSQNDGVTWKTNVFQDYFLQRRGYFGPGSASKITGNAGSSVTVESSSGFEVGKMADVVEEGGVPQLSVTPDKKSEEWVMMPRYVFLDVHYDGKTENCLPLVFKPDGSLQASQNKIVVEIYDTRDVGVGKDQKVGGRTRTIHLFRNTGAIREQPLK